jgi:hypothetical protein
MAVIGFDKHRFGTRLNEELSVNRHDYRRHS